MGFIYLAALIFGLGATLLQLFGSTSGADADADAGSSGDSDTEGDAHLSSGPLWIVLSLRFWVFAALAFGLTGSLLSVAQVAGALSTLILALGMGVASGAGASWVFRALARNSPNTGSQTDELVGRVGRVLLPCSPTRQGKIRIEHKGQSTDLVATTDDAELAVGAWVLVDELRGGVAQVSRVPEELLP